MPDYTDEKLKTGSFVFLILMWKVFSKNFMQMDYFYQNFSENGFKRII